MKPYNNSVSIHITIVVLWALILSGFLNKSNNTLSFQKSSSNNNSNSLTLLKADRDSIQCICLIIISTTIIQLRIMMPLLLNSITNINSN